MLQFITKGGCIHHKWKYMSHSWFWLKHLSSVPNLKGATENIPLIDFIVGILNDPTPEQEECHAPKPILLNTGSVRKTDTALILN